MDHSPSKLELVPPKPLTEARIINLCQLADGLLLELCEAGLYELGNPKSPEGKMYNDLARAAKALDFEVQKRMAHD